jgi:hypothetical protein
MHYLFDVLVLLLKAEYKIKYQTEFWPGYAFASIDISDVYYVL